MSFSQKSDSNNELNESVTNERIFGIFDSKLHTTKVLLLGSGELGKEIAI